MPRNKKQKGIAVLSPLKKLEMKNLITIPALAFINREEEAFLITYNCLHNATKDVSGKLILVTSCQMNGSGKTEMGKNAIKALNEHQVSRLNRRYTPDIVNKYLSSEYVLIDLSLLAAPSENLPTFALALAYLTWCSFAKCIENQTDLSQSEFHGLKLFSIRDVIIHYAKKYNKHFFIHWDEVGCIENNCYNSFVDVSWSPKEDEYDFKTRLVRYYDFWLNMNTILSLPFAYSFCTSKTLAFSLLGLKLFPPTDHKHIVLGGLSASSILLAMHETQIFENTSIFTHLCIPEELVNYFCDTLYDRTKGVPRLVHKALEGLCNDRGLLTTEQYILDAIDKIAYNYIINIRGEEIFVKQSVLQPAWYTIYVSLIIASLLNIPINKFSVVTVGNQKINLLEVIERLDLFIEPTTHNESIKIVFPGYVLCHFSVIQRNSDVRLPLISPILENADVLELDREPLEWLNKVILGFTLAQCKGRLWKETLEFLADSELFEEVAFKIDENQPVSYLPAIKPGITPQFNHGIKRLVNSNVWKTQAPPSDWPYIMKHLFRANTIGHPAPKSHSPDLLFNTKDAILAFANKLNSPSNPVTWPNLIEEINKAAFLTQVKPVCLIVVALHLGTEIQNALGNKSHLFLFANHWYNFDAESVGEKHKAYKFFIPEKMEVVILGEEGLALFLGSVNLNALRKFVNDRLDINLLCDSLLPKLTIPLPQTKSNAKNQIIKIAKKSGIHLCEIAVTPLMTVGNLISALEPKLPQTLRVTKTISLRYSPSSTTEFAPTTLVADLNNITDSTLYLILEDIQSVEDFL